MRRTLVLALAAFAIGIFVGPLLPVANEQRTIVLTGYPNEEQRLRTMTTAGWVVRRTDRVDIGQLVTLERPRLAALAEMVRR